MVIVTTTVDSAAYVQVSTTDCFLQNMSSYPLYLTFSVTLPTVDTNARHLQHEGDNPREFRVVGDLLVEGQAGNEVEIVTSKWDSLIPSFVVAATQNRQINSYVRGRDVAKFILSKGKTLDSGDCLKVQVANKFGTGSLTQQLGSYLTNLER